MKPSKPMPSLQLKTLLLLLLLSALLMGCGATLPECQPVSQPLPSPPLTSSQLSRENYSETAQQNISEWQKKLRQTRVMRD